MDFVHDQLADGRAFRVLTVVDNWSRESVLLEAGFRLTGESVPNAYPCTATCSGPTFEGAPSSLLTRSAADRTFSM